MLNVSKAEMIDLYQALGFKTADGWSIKKLATKATRLPDVVAQMGEIELSDGLDELLTSILAAITKKEPEEIVVTDDGGKGTPKAKKKTEAAISKTEQTDNPKATLAKEDTTTSVSKTKRTRMSRPTRAHVVAACIKSRTSDSSTVEVSLEAITVTSDQMYANSGGKSNLKATDYAARIALSALEVFDIVKFDGHTITILKKR